MTTTLGIDPGLANTGAALLDGKILVRTTTIRTDSHLRLEARLGIIAAAVLEILVATQPKRAVIEGYTWQGSARSANPNSMVLSRVVGTIEGVCRGEGVEVVTLTRNQILSGLCGNLWASKRVVERSLELRGYRAPNEHERDAIAAAIVGDRAGDMRQRVLGAGGSPDQRPRDRDARSGSVSSFRQRLLPGRG